ncbi:MAG: LTA synthase family protein, partial [Tumebacillaceae bacterium]
MGIIKNMKFQGVRTFLSHNQDFLVVNLLLVAKILTFQFGIGLDTGSWALIFSSAAILVILSCWILALPHRSRLSFLLVFNIFVTAVLFSDLLFYRFFSSVLDIPVLYQFRQVKGVSSSITALFHKRDLLLFVDLVFLIPYLLRLYSKRKGHRFPVRVRWSQVAALFVVAIGVLAFNMNSVAKAYGAEVFKEVYSNKTVLQRMGILNYHLVDLVQFVGNRNTSIPSDEENSIKSYMDQHRQATPKKMQGVAKGKNVIIVQLEAMQNFLIGRSVDGQEVTPNLNKLMKSSLYFDNYFTQIGQGNTSDAEFMSLNSLYPADAGSAYIMKSSNTFQSMPKVLKDSGYKSADAYHAYHPEFWNRANMYISEGFDHFYNDTTFNNDDIAGMGLSDSGLYKQALPLIKAQAKPSMSFMVTLSGHYPYQLPDDKNGLHIQQGEYSQFFTDYLQAQHYADQSIGEFMDQLQQEGMLDNSVVVFYGDHFGSGFTNEDLEKFLELKQPIDDYMAKELYKVPLFIHLPKGQYAGTQHISGGQMDLYPTLANLLGLDTSKMVYFGQDLLNAKDGFSAFRYYFGDGSFATDDLFYLANDDGKFADGSCHSRTTGQTVDLNACSAGYQKAKDGLHMSDLILDTNGLKELIPSLK